MYFECNLPQKAPYHLHPSTIADCNNVLDALHRRMEKLNEAHVITGLDGATFSMLAKFLFDNFFERFEKMCAEEIAAFVKTIDSGEKAEARIDWPNATVLIDTSFVKTEEWEAVRCFSIGGSDAAVVLGISPYRTAQELYHDKVRTPVKIPEENKEAIFARGHVLEDDVVNAFCKLTGAKRIPESRMFISKKHPRCSANIDALIQTADGRIFVYEAKTTIVENRQAWVNNKVPRQYVPQTRQYPAVLDDDRICGTYIGCLFTEDYSLGGQYLGSGFDEDRFLVRCIDRDKDEEDELLKEEEDFWSDYVESGIEPPPSKIPEKDIAVFLRYTGPADRDADIVNLDINDFEDDIKEYLELGEKRSLLEKKAENIKERQVQISERFIKELKTAIEGSVKIDDQFYYEIKYSPRKKREVDYELLRLKYPEAFNSCVTNNPDAFRVFTLKKKKIWEKNKNGA